MLQVGGYPNSSNVTNVKTAYTFVNGEKKYFWKDKTIYDNYWNDNYYSRIIYAFLLNNSTNNTLRVVYLDDSEAIKTKDFTLPNVTGYKNRGIDINYDFQVNGNSLLIVLEYTDPSRSSAFINKLFYISDVLTSSTVIDINFDDGVLDVRGNSYEVEYYRLAQYGIWLTLAKTISTSQLGQNTYEYNTYFIPLPNQNVTISDAYKKNLWSPVGKTITRSQQSNTIGGRLLYCIFDNNNNDISAYILKDTPTGESLVKTIKNFPIAFKPSIISGIYAYMLVDYSTIKILNLLTNESHNATGTIMHSSEGLLDWPFEIIPNNSLWTVYTGSPRLVSLIRVSGEDDTFESLSLDNYSGVICRIYDKQTQLLFNVVSTSDGNYLYKTLTDKIKITLPTNFSWIIGKTFNNHCLVACDNNSSRTSFPFQISKDYGTTWTAVGNALGYDS